MEAKELRISNTINHKEKGLITIKGITEHCGDYKIDTDLGWVYLKNCEPIETTGEWLIKFGFIQCKNEYWYEKDLLSISHDLGVYEIKGAKETISLMRINKIKHVHTLQNIYFALTKEELTHE